MFPQLGQWISDLELGLRRLRTDGTNVSNGASVLLPLPLTRIDLEWFGISYSRRLPRPRQCPGYNQWTSRAADGTIARARTL